MSRWPAAALGVALVAGAIVPAAHAQVESREGIYLQNQNSAAPARAGGDAGAGRRRPGRASGL